MLRNIDIVDQMFSRIAPSDLVRYIELGGGQPPVETAEDIRNRLDSGLAAPRPSAGALEYMLAHYDPNNSQARAPGAYKAAAGLYSAGKEAGFYSIDRSEAGGLELTLYRPTVMFMDQDGVQVDDKEVLKEIKGKHIAGKKTASEKEASKLYSIDSKALRTERYALMDIDGTYVALELPSRDSGCSIDNLTKDAAEKSVNRLRGDPNEKAYEALYNELYAIYDKKDGKSVKKPLRTAISEISKNQLLEIRLDYYEIPAERQGSSVITDGLRQDSIGFDLFGTSVTLVKAPRSSHDERVNEISQSEQARDLYEGSKPKEESNPLFHQKLMDGASKPSVTSPEGTDTMSSNYTALPIDRNMMINFISQN
jgi:hypothetical protein